MIKTKTHLSMKRIFISILFFLFSYTNYSQTNHADSLKAVLANVSSPLKKFDIIRSDVQMILTLQGGNIDSSSTIQLLQIAQQQKNDSLLAIAYNWIGSYFSFTKGDNISGLEYFFKGIPVAEKANDKRRLSSLYFDIAIAYYALICKNTRRILPYIMVCWKQKQPAVLKQTFLFTIHFF